MDIPTLSLAVRDLLSHERLCELGPGTPNEPMRPRLQTLTTEELFAHAPIRRPDFAAACMAGLWLYHDFLDESHELSQGLSSVEGSFWHGIMHRREPDYSNAAYWFRKVGRHPIYEALGPAAQELAEAATPGSAVPVPWDPFWFIDFCEDCVRKKRPADTLARLIQKREWELLFEYCYRKAIA